MQQDEDGLEPTINNEKQFSNNNHIAVTALKEGHALHLYVGNNLLQP